MNAARPVRPRRRTVPARVVLGCGFGAQAILLTATVTATPGTTARAAPEPASEPTTDRAAPEPTSEPAPVAPAARAVNGERARVVLDAVACPAVSQSELRRLVGLELGDLLAPPAADPEPRSPAPRVTDEARLTVRCDGARAALRARVAGRPQTVERTVRLDDFPAGAAPRGLALAGIELLATLDAGVREKVEGNRPSAPAPASLPSLSIAVVGLRRQFLGGAGLGAWGSRLDVVRDRARLRLAGDLEVAATGTSTTELGEAHALLGSIAGFAGARFAPAAGVTLSLAAGARAGLARLDGSPSPEVGAIGHTVWRPWWGPAVSARGTWGSPRLAGLATIEFGLTARGAEALAATTTVLAARGPWLTAAAGVQF